MNSKAIMLAACVCVAVLPIARAEETEPGLLRQFGDDCIDDIHQFYRPKPMGALWIGLAAVGTMANTSADEDVRAWYQDSVRSADTDRAAAIAKPLGNHWYTLPVYLGAGALDAFGDRNRACGMVGEWGQRSLRTLALGAPLLGGFQWVLGSSRPIEERGSEWRPFKDSNGVSGHAFVGAVPFLSAAGMVRNRAAKSALVLCSAASGLSRINDDAHYFSQASYGWWLACVSAVAVDTAGHSGSGMAAVPVAGPDCTGLALAFSF